MKLMAPLYRQEEGGDKTWLQRKLDQRDALGNQGCEDGVQKLNFRFQIDWTANS